MLWFTKLSPDERRLARSVWHWLDEGKPASHTPELKGKVLDRLIAKLWALESSYQSSVQGLELVIDDLEKVEDEQSIEESETDKEHLDASVEKLKRIIETLEWLRTEQKSRLYGNL